MMMMMARKRLEKDKKSEEAPAQAVPEPAGAALEPDAKRLRAEKDSRTQACDVASKIRPRKTRPNIAAKKCRQQLQHQPQ